MSNKSIISRSDLPEAARKELTDAGLDGLNVGDTFICDENDRCEIIRINRIDVDKKAGEISYIGYGHATQWDCSEFSKEYGGAHGAEEFNSYLERHRYTKITEGSFAEWQQKARDIINGKADISLYKDADSDMVNSETALMSNGSKESLIALQQDLTAKKQTAALVTAFVNWEMQRQMSELKAVKNKMYGVLAEFGEKIKKIMRVITIIELYMGIDEELFCIQEGQKAPVDTPITFRQAVLYMDEEIGHWENGGLDYTNIAWFDEWLVKGKGENFKKLFPEEKGMVVFRPRRFPKDYNEGDPLKEYFMNKENVNSTYLLIRNGECLYRVFTEKLVILPRLFPLRRELQTLFDEMNVSKHRSSYEKEKHKEKFEDSMYHYRKRAMLMQGLIDRSEVFHPLPCKINIFNLEETKELVNFVYDDEATLPSGRLTFKDWQKQLNEGITHGSRVLVTGEYGGIFFGQYGKEERQARLFGSLKYHHNLPDTPDAGIYDVEVYKEETTEWLKEDEYEKQKANVLQVIKTRQDHILRHYMPDDPLTKPTGKNVEGTDDYIKEYRVIYMKEHLTIMYTPGDTIWNDDECRHVPRSKRVRWEIWSDDKFILHWDRLSEEDIDFYLESRVDRPNYLDMMPVLQRTKKLIQEEQQKEAPFIQLLTGSLTSQMPGYLMEDIRERVVRCIDWWKWKNIIKRPIDKDDVLAIRMIEKRVKSKNYHNLKWD